MSARLPPYARPTPEGVALHLKVQPRASRDEFAGVAGSELRVRISAPPVDAAANEALVEFLATQLGCHRRQVHLVRGQTSRHKVVTVAGVSLEELALRLPAA